MEPLEPSFDGGDVPTSPGGGKVILMDSLELLCDGSNVLPLVESLLKLKL